MSQSQVHIIHKQVYNIAVKKQQLGIQLQQQLHDINLQYILPALSNKLDQFFSTEEITTLGKIEIEYIPAASFSMEILLRIEQIMFQKANEVFPVTWRQVKEISPTKSGKPQIIQNFIAHKPANFYWWMMAYTNFRNAIYFVKGF